MEELVVQWFANRISHGGLVTKKQFNELLQEAKEMEKQRIIKTYEVAKMRGMSYEEDVYHKNNWGSAEQYFNETFGRPLPKPIQEGKTRSNRKEFSPEGRQAPPPPKCSKRS